MNRLPGLSAVLVTRGNVAMLPIIDGLYDAGVDEVLVWDNGRRGCASYVPTGAFDEWPVAECGVFGRYAAIDYALGKLIYVQDDDCILPADSVAALYDRYTGTPGCEIAANMPDRFRPHYPDSCLVGFGAVFGRGAPERAFERFNASGKLDPALFNRTCDVVFTALTRDRELLDVPYADRDFASDPDRMWRQPEHHGERQRVLELARAARDAA